MPRADDPFAFESDALRFGVAESRPQVTFTRGDHFPAPILPGCITVSGTITGEFDAWSDLRNWRCPGCDVPFAELEPGHSWSSARGCWTETEPIDGYGRPIVEASDD